MGLKATFRLNVYTGNTLGIYRVISSYVFLHAFQTCKLIVYTYA